MTEWSKRMLAVFALWGGLVSKVEMMGQADEWSYNIMLRYRYGCSWYNKYLHANPTANNIRI